jgi:hypothetical protein
MRTNETKGPADLENKNRLLLLLLRIALKRKQLPCRLPNHAMGDYFGLTINEHSARYALVLSRVESGLGRADAAN